MLITKDNRLVCIHDPIISGKTFSEIKKDFPNKDFCYDVSLKKFLQQNPEIIIITDFKTDNLKGLNFIKNYFDKFSKRFIVYGVSKGFSFVPKH